MGGQRDTRVLGSPWPEPSVPPHPHPHPHAPRWHPGAAGAARKASACSSCAVSPAARDATAEAKPRLLGPPRGHRPGRPALPGRDTAVCRRRPPGHRAQAGGQAGALPQGPPRRRRGAGAWPGARRRGALGSLRAAPAGRPSVHRGVTLTAHVHGLRRAHRAVGTRRTATPTRRAQSPGLDLPGQVDVAEPFPLSEGGPEGPPPGLPWGGPATSASQHPLEAGSRRALPANRPAARGAGVGRPDAPCGLAPSKPPPGCPPWGAPTPPPPGTCPSPSCSLCPSSEAGAASCGRQSSSADSAGSSALGHRVRVASRQPRRPWPRPAGGGAHPPQLTHPGREGAGEVPCTRHTGHTLGPAAGPPTGGVSRKCAGETHSQGPARTECLLSAEPQLQGPGMSRIRR